MRVVTATEDIDVFNSLRKPTVFLAGGIQNCPHWQRKALELMKDDDVIIYNPRRDDFPIGCPDVAREQITWEFEALHAADIFSMWFCDTDKSDQPICFYELGRYTAVKDDARVVCVGAEPGFRRRADVEIQLELAYPDIEIASTLEGHVRNIRTAARRLAEKRTIGMWISPRTPTNWI